MFCSLEPDACDAGVLARGRAQLQAFPLEKRRLGPAVDAAGRPMEPLPGRKWKVLAREIVPIEARPASSFEWKSSPYRLHAERSPNTEYTGLDYLVAFWLYDSVCQTRSDCTR